MIYRAWLAYDFIELKTIIRPQTDRSDTGCNCGYGGYPPEVAFRGVVLQEVTIEQLGDIVRDVFDDDEVTITENTTAQDVDGWDSLNHIRFIVSVERHFNIRFTSREVESVENLGELLKVINAKLSG